MKLGIVVQNITLIKIFEGDTSEGHVVADVSTFLAGKIFFPNIDNLYIVEKEILC